MSLWNELTDVHNVLSSIIEDQHNDVDLPVGIIDSVSLISGSLPPGMVLTNNSISGIPEHVSTNTKYIFTLRAYKDDIIEDRSFAIEVVGKNSPVWLTSGGSITSEIADDPSSMYVKSGLPVKYQFLAIDEDVYAGELLKFIVTDGKLPPGLQLTEYGLLYGIIGAEIKLQDGTIVDFTYDYPHTDDFIMGYHSKFYDTSRKNEIISENLTVYENNKVYTFEISVYDGKTPPVPRTFVITVGGTDSWILDGDSLPNNDNSVIWLTPENLGSFRANKNITIYLDVLDSMTMTGFADFKICDFNFDLSVSEFPNGLVLDEERGIIYGKTPILNETKKDFKFLLKANSKYSPIYSYKTFYLRIIHENYTNFNWKTSSYLGTLKTYEKSFKRIFVESTVNNEKLNFDIKTGNLPPGLQLTTDGYIIGNALPIDPLHDGEFKFTVIVWNNNGISDEKEFNLMVDKSTVLPYNEVYVKPLISVESRQQFDRLLADVYTRGEEYVYRMQDDEFGLNDNMLITLCSSVATVEHQRFFDNVKGFKRRRLRYNGIKNITVFYPGTKSPLYEMVYIDMLDPLHFTENSLFYLKENIYQLGDPDFRNEKLWLRTLRYSNNYKSSIAIPIVFVKVGYGDMIKRYISSLDHSINTFDFDIDRITIQSSSDNADPKYIMFSERDPQIFL